jgi:hypothetical protein
MTIEWDERGFKRALEQAANQGLREVGRKGQRVLDRVRSQTTGKSAAEIKPILARAWRSEVGGDLSADQLSTMAEAMAAGRRVVLKPEDVRL